MPGTSAYIQISKYALLEYQYNSEYIPVSGGSGSAGALRLENKYLNTYQFLNTNQSVDLTGNVLTRSAARMGAISNRWAYFDINTAVPIYQTNSNFDIVTETANLITNAGQYDTARLHILSGFDFPGLDGLILQIQWKQWQLNSSTNNTLFDVANQVYLKGQQQINFSINPLFLGDRLYDRYIDVKIPALYDVNQDFWNSPAAPNTIGWNYSFNNVGFLQNSQIFANLFEIDSIDELNGNKYLLTGNSYNASFNAADNYSQLAVTVSENPTYDYIEYYPTWNGAFIETYINDLNSVGGDWVVINQIEMYEQVGTSSLRTANMTMLQDGNYDQPGIFRPVVQNASLAFSYTIDYTMRFFNRVDNTEIIRKSSYTSTNVKKYGKQLDKINVLQGFAPLKVYNKVVQMDAQDTANYTGITVPKEIVTQLVVTPVFYDTNMISVDSANDINQSLGDIVWPQGTNTIYIGPFDNFVKFKIFTTSANNRQNVSLDMSSYVGNIALSFDTVDNNRVSIPVYTDINVADPSIGELLFRMDTSTAVKVLASTNKSYFITNSTNPETVLYSGKFDDIANKSKGQTNGAKSILESFDTQIAAKKATLASLEASITTANTTIIGGNTTSATSPAPTITAPTMTSAANAVLVESQATAAVATEVATAQLNQAQVAQSTALAQAAENPAAINFVEIPGVTPNLGGNPQSAIRPLVENPSEPASGSNPGKNPSKQGNTPLLTMIDKLNGNNELL